ncbi:MAG TPA: ATP-binding protein [Bryobacteraceae bacterium]|nr:ATP-binding protein [Bryobacteraceae bacterium]
MHLHTSSTRFWRSWLFVGLLASLCAFLAVVQNRWIDQVSVAERDRLHASLQTDLARLSEEFDRQVARSVAGLTPDFHEVSQLGAETACSRQYLRWKETNDPIIRRVGLVKFEHEEPMFYQVDPATGQFSKADWPVDWSETRQRFESRAGHLPPREVPPAESQVLDFPLYGSMQHGRPEDGFPPPPPLEDWLIVELDVDYIRSTLLPELSSKYLASSETPAYEMKLVLGAPATRQRSVTPDASVGLLDVGRIGWRRPGGPGRPDGPHGPGPPPPRQTSVPRQPRWQLLIYGRGGSLDSLIEAARWRNVALSGGILLMILTMILALLRYSRRSQELADLQMNFVAGVSHELRTPLTVIRTAAFNLRGKTATRPDQVEKYGHLIQRESEKLSNLVDQVLRHGAIRAGQVIGERHPAAAWKLIESSIHASLVSAPGTDVTLETHVDSKLPLILADELALRHALQNLLDNAVKYGLEGSNWIGVSATEVCEGAARSVEFRVSDRGPGIPFAEQDRLFDAFFRGKSAVQDQVHGTGLGLSIVKSIIEAHGGTIRVNSEPQKYDHGVFFHERGDLIVLFTDGVSESMNVRDEEWGEERLIELAKTCHGLPALEVMRRILAAAQAFAAGAAQHDDMTLVVLRVT